MVTDRERIDTLEREGNLATEEAADLRAALAQQPRYWRDELRTRVHDNPLVGSILWVLFGVSLLGPFGLTLLNSLMMPRFMHIFADLNAPLPQITQLCLSLPSHVPLLALLTFVYFASMLFLLRRRHYRSASIVVTGSLVLTTLSAVALVLGYWVPLLRIIQNL